MVPFKQQESKSKYDNFDKYAIEEGIVLDKLLQSKSKETK